MCVLEGQFVEFVIARPDLKTGSLETLEKALLLPFLKGLHHDLLLLLRGEQSLVLNAGQVGDL